jgi:methylglutaconyl-CoA hydratase
MAYSHLDLSTDARGVTRVALNRPATLNAFDEELIAQLADAFTALDADPAVRVVVLAAEGRVFCAGADIGWMQRAAANDDAANLADARRFAAMLDSLARCRKPVVARVQGAAYGGGVGLACASDIVVAGARAKFCVSEAKFGILPAVIGPYLVGAVGLRQAKRLALTMAVVQADEALRLGLVHSVAADEALDAAVEEVVAMLLAGGPQALAEIKALFAQLADGPVTADARELTAQTISRVRATDEAREGFAAFMDKRPPAWQHRLDSIDYNES